jgi:hypothetical protein
VILAVDPKDERIAMTEDGDFFRKSGDRWRPFTPLRGYKCRCGAVWTLYNGLEACPASAAAIGSRYALSHLWEKP